MTHTPGPVPHIRLRRSDYQLLIAALYTAIDFERDAMIDRAPRARVFAGQRCRSYHLLAKRIERAWTFTAHDAIRSRARVSARATIAAPLSVPPASENG